MAKDSMADPRPQLAQNLSRVRDRIERAAERAGRTPHEVQLIGVTKYVGPDQAAALLAAGCSDLGESRPQQLWEKAEDPRLQDARWHLIGHLQRNKAKRTAPLLDAIHSLDSRRIIDAVADAIAPDVPPLRGLIEINCSGEPEKHGLPPEQLPSLLDNLATRPEIEIVGLMTMASRTGGASEARRNFAKLRELRDRVRARLDTPQVALPELSMGMSGDFEEAILEGATLVRVGSALWEGVG